ncbi:MAG: hypothetical protein AAFY43_06550 [Pseudomonadota bacterium]
MTLQNRVDPFSAIHAVPSRGLFTGNRGILHDPETQTLKKQTWTTNGWISCVLAFKDRKLPLMGRGHYTPLFFLDELTGFAAGHRPCFECRRDNAQAFSSAVATQRGDPLRPSAKRMDAELNAEMKPRLRRYDPEPRPVATVAELPDGAMYAIDGRCFVKWKGQGRIWSFDGYGGVSMLPPRALRLTPELMCAALQGGYAPEVHPSLHANTG